MEARQTETSNDTIWILGLPGAEAEDGDRSRWFRREDARVGRQAVPIDRLRENIQDFVESLAKAVEPIPQKLAGFSIESIELHAEISATGSVSLLGTGGEVSGTGGITFTLHRLNGQVNPGSVTVTP